jgi:predicted phospho-2-dehydro-3-deoxyheptonate aldolase
MVGCLGKELRMKRIFNSKSGNVVLVPIDHGVTLGPIQGINCMQSTIDLLNQTDIDGIIVHKGTAKQHCQNWKKSLIIHLNASTELSPNANTKITVCTVEEAIKLGADAVSIHINLGDKNDTKMLSDLGETANICDIWGMPLVAMMYVCGESVKDAIGNIKFAARVASELGADIVKVGYTGDADSFAEVVDGCSIPVIVAGGAKIDSDQGIIEMFQSAMKTGARGIACGRNIFQRENAKKFADDLCEIVHRNSKNM